MTAVARLAGSRAALVAVVALALAVRVAVVLGTPRFAPNTDAEDYDRIAISLVAENRFPVSVVDPAGGPTAFRGPAYPLVLAAAYELSGVSSAHARWRAGRLEEALLGTAAVALMWLIAVRLWGAAAALATGLIGAVYPPLVLIGSSLMSESLFIPLALGAVLAALVAGERGRARWAALAGVLIGLAALTRSDGLILVAPLGWLLVRGPRGGPGGRGGRGFGAVAAMLAALAVTLVPWTVRNYHEFHRLVPITTESGYLLAGIYNPASQHAAVQPGLWRPATAQLAAILARHPGDDEAQVSDALDADARRYVEAHPLSLLRTGFWDTLRLLDLAGVGFERQLGTYAAYPPTLTLISVYASWLVLVLALAGAITPDARREAGVVWGCIAALYAGTVLVDGGIRYRSPCDPFLVMLAGLALLDAGRRLERRAARRRGPGAPVASAAG
jgi:4-amino-4-deoxy-L-arabinose transferase-like glycosyltransferase